MSPQTEGDAETGDDGPWWLLLVPGLVFLMLLAWVIRCVIWALERLP